MWKYLLARTQGVMGSLSILVKDAAMTAIDTGAERLSLELLDSVEVDLDRQERYRAAGKRQSRR